MENATRTWARASSSRIHPPPPEQPKPPTGRSNEISPRGIRVQHSMGSIPLSHEGNTNSFACRDRAASNIDRGRPCPPDRWNAEKLPTSLREARAVSDDDDDVGTALPPRLGHWKVTREILTDLDRQAGLVDGISRTYRASGRLQSISESTEIHPFPQMSSRRSTSDGVPDLGESSGGPRYKHTVSWNQGRHSEPDPVQDFTSNVSSSNKPNSTPLSQSINRISAITAKQGDNRCTGTSSKLACLPRTSSDTYQYGMCRPPPPEDRLPVSLQNHQGSDAIQGGILKEMIGLSENIEVLLSLTDPLNIGTTSTPPLSPQSASAVIRIEGSTESQFLPRGPLKEAPGITFKSQEELYAWCRRQLSAEQTSNGIRLNLSTHLETLKQRTHMQEEQRCEERDVMRVELSACAALVHERDVRLEALRLENLEHKRVLESQQAALECQVGRKPSTKEGL